MFSRQDSREDLKPWAIINAVALIQLHVFCVNDGGGAYGYVAD